MAKPKRPTTYAGRVQGVKMDLYNLLLEMRDLPNAAETHDARELMVDATDKLAEAWRELARLQARG